MPPDDVVGGNASALPVELAYIHEAIERSRPMLEWADDWDGEGSPGYTGATWERAVDFIIRNAVRLYEQLGTRILAPVIRPGPGGSIDIDWQSGQRGLLLNVPVDQAEPATFYGRDTSGTTIEGTLDTSGRNQWMLMWLAA